MTSDSQFRERSAAGMSLDALLRRVFDVTVALCGILCFLPVLIPVVIAIRLDSPGPIFFSQHRLGQHGRLFRLYKFRKFHDGTAGYAVTLKNDDRMTRVGRFLERTKIDEVPQLWNVLRGDMAIVGPRPETLDFADCFQGPYHAVLDHRPGIFGPNQVHFRNEQALFPERGDPHEFYVRVLFPAKARMDLSYFPRRSLGQDIVWIVRGVLGIFGVGLPADPLLTDPQSVGSLPDGFRNAEKPASIPD